MGMFASVSIHCLISNYYDMDLLSETDREKEDNFY